VDARNGQTVMIELNTVEGSSPIEIYKCMRIVYGKDTIDVGSDAGFVGLRAANRTLVIGRATADQSRQRRRSGVLRGRFYNQFRAIFYVYWTVHHCNS